MPDSRRPLPLPPMRAGAFDDPRASSEASTPQTRRQRLRRAILGTNELAQEVINMANTDRQGRRSTVGGLTRRRQRSSSERDELSTSTPEGEDRANRRSTKRRRLNAGVEALTKKAIKYGYYGQVEPGRLKLELVSCDGGQHIDHRHPETPLGPENLLRYDKSVYCSELPQSNIILKHADDTAFCLEKLHIMGPEIGFTAPVRAGVVHVAMTMADLQQYVQLRNNHPRPDEQSTLPPHARRSRYSLNRRAQLQREIDRRPSSPELLTVAEALQDPYINGVHPSDVRGPADSTPDAEAEAEADTYCDSNPTTSYTTWPLNPSNPTLVTRTQPLTILSDEDAGPEESSPQEVLDFRSQRERLMRRRYDIENWHRTRWAGYATDSADTRAVEGMESYLGTRIDPDRRPRPDETLALSRLLARQREQARSRRRRSSATATSDDDESLPALEPITPPSQETASRPAAPVAPETTATQHCALPSPPPAQPPRMGGRIDDAGDTADDNVRTAPFHVARGKYKVAITFDPPVSGRFVLLKLWAGDAQPRVDSNGGEDGAGEDEGEQRGNVDVQSVVAKGWMGGMRFFPSVGVK